MAGETNNLEAVLADVVRRRDRGEVLSDAEVIAAHPELMPRLGQELEALHGLHRLFLAAQKAGPIEAAATAEAATGGQDNENYHAGLRIRGYTIEKEISAGGQGAVFQAVQESTGRTVAIKVIAGGPLVSSRQRSRFEREADILAQLDHPNIVGIIDRGRTADGSLFLVMKFIDGWALDEYLERRRREGNLTVEEVVVLLAQVAQAVEEAHQRGIVHRDLKPSNIRIDQRGRPHVLDFGLARLSDASDSGPRALAVTLTGQIVGSLPWASPEHISGNPETVGFFSDVYSMGVMLYQALAGTFPYPIAGPMHEVMDHIARTVPAPPGKAKAARALNVGAGLDAIVLKALAKSPRDRYATAGDLARELEAYLAGDRRAGRFTPRLLAWLRRILLATAGVALCLVGIWYHLSVNSTATPAIQLPSYTNGIGMRLLRLPPGQFLMGSPANENGRNADEQEHTVRLSGAFYLATTEVTQAQYHTVMGSLPAGQEWVGDDLPVAYVSWDEATEFCRKLSQKDNRSYRLPNEAEWEYACRAGSSGRYAGARDLDAVGWYAGNSGDRPHPVAGKRPNAWGFYDMLGNVSEWCIGGHAPAWSATQGADPVGPMDSPHRIIRGGSILDPPQRCRAAQRGFLQHAMRQTDVGFRVAMDEPPPARAISQTAPTSRAVPPDGR